MDEIFHPELYNNDAPQLKEIKRCVEVALLRTQFDRADRPHMEDVLRMLHGLKEMPTPKKPSYMVDSPDLHDDDWIFVERNDFTVKA